MIQRLIAYHCDTIQPSCLDHWQGSIWFQSEQVHFLVATNGVNDKSLQPDIRVNRLEAKDMDLKEDFEDLILQT